MGQLPEESLAADDVALVYDEVEGPSPTTVTSAAWMAGSPIRHWPATAAGRGGTATAT